MRAARFSQRQRIACNNMVFDASTISPEPWYKKKIHLRQSELGLDKTEASDLESDSQLRQDTYRSAQK